MSEASAVPIWAGLLVAFVVLWEQRPLASIGLRPLGWHSLAWGVVLWLATSYAAAPLLVRFIVWLGLGGFDHGLARVLALPLWYRVLAVVTAGVVEETLFRGFAVERLAELSGSYWIAGVVSVAGFALLHLPFWGLGPVVTVFFTGGLLTAFFVWQQDLLANALAHTLVDATGLILGPRPASGSPSPPLACAATTPACARGAGLAPSALSPVRASGGPS